MGGGYVVYGPADDLKAILLDVTEEVKGQVDILGGRPSKGVGWKDLFQSPLKAVELDASMVGERDSDEGTDRRHTRSPECCGLEEEPRCGG